MKTELSNRILWFDGINQVEPDLIPFFLFSGIPIEKIVAIEKTPDITKFNLLSEFELSHIKNDIEKLDFSWNIPQFYKDINLKEKYTLIASMYGSEYIDRLNLELKEVEKRNLSLLFKTLIYIIDTLNVNNIVYGIGRGSSCASLLLYFIGVHKIDPVKYNISHIEFFHD